MCFGERTTFVCPMCENRSWETKWYNFNADADECALGQPLGACADPYMAYHQENRYCTACLSRMHEASSPSPDPETFHPEDSEHEHPQLLHYEESEHQTLQNTGQLTMPMRVSRALEAHAPHGTTLLQAVVPEHALMQEITNIVSSRGSRTLDPVRIVDPAITETPRNPEDGLYATTGADGNTPVPPSTATSTNEADAANGEGENTTDPPATDPPATPARPITPSRIPGYVFQGPVPQTALNDTPLPSYDQAVSRGQAPIYAEYDPEAIPINRRTLERVALYAYFIRVSNTDLMNRKFTSVYAKIYTSLELHPGFVELKKISESIADLMYGVEKEALRRDNILFKHNTTSATQEQAISWIADVTRNPENSVHSHARRFAAWVDLLEAEVDAAIYTHGASLPGGDLPPARRAINLVFEQEEMRNQIAQQGEHWAGSPDAWVTPTELDEECIRYIRRHDREFPSVYDVDDRDDLDHPLYPSMPRIVSSTGRYVQVPNVFGASDPSISTTAEDMMDVD